MLGTCISVPRLRGVRITQITYPNSSTNAFTYNAWDTRVGKVDSGGTKTYRRDGVGVTAPVLSDGVSAFTPGISLHNGGASKFLHGDRVGTFAHETDANQNTTATKQYDAFGMPLSSTGLSVSPFGFAGGRGYQEDQDSGLKLLGHRYYDPATGRFLTRDPTGDGRNWYTYCDNNPLRWADPAGLSKGRVVIIIGSGIPGHDQDYIDPADEQLAEDYYEDLKEQGYEPEIVRAPDDALLDRILGLDDLVGVVVISHGNETNNYAGIVYGTDDKGRPYAKVKLDPDRIRRARKGKRRLEFIILECCNLCKGANRDAWEAVVDHVAGYDDVISIGDRSKGKIRPKWGKPRPGTRSPKPRIWSPGIRAR